MLQQLEIKLKNTPRDTSLVPCSVNSQLNRDENLSVVSKVRVSNNPEVNQRCTNNQDLPSKVFVLNKENKPLMPTKPSRARKMIEKGKAIIFKRNPFTIQLTYDCPNIIQPIQLGIDTGYGNIGFSAITKIEELISGTLVLDGKTKERLDEKRMYRRNRRNRLWHREPRFLNRARPKGWLPPSIERRYQTNLSLIEQIKKILPISSITIEIAKFDIQKLENPNISGIEYQQGDMYEYQNVRSYLMSREKGICEHCKKDFINNPSHIHHRTPKHLEGSNRLENLMLIHEKCHTKIHGNIKLLKKYEKPSIKTYKQTTFMSIINKRFWNDVPDLKVTFGNITFVNRNKLGIPKTHVNDAFVIASGVTQKRVKPFEIIQRHRNNRVLQVNRKGFKPSIKRKKSIISPLDLFWVKGKKYYCKSMFGYGKYISYGDMKKKEYFNTKLIENYFNYGSLIWKSF